MSSRTNVDFLSPSDKPELRQTTREAGARYRSMHQLDLSRGMVAYGGAHWITAIQISAGVSVEDAGRSVRSSITTGGINVGISLSDLLGFAFRDAEVEARTGMAIHIAAITKRPGIAYIYALSRTSDPRLALQVREATDAVTMWYDESPEMALFCTLHLARGGGLVWAEERWGDDEYMPGGTATVLLNHRNRRMNRVAAWFSGVPALRIRPWVPALATLCNGSMIRSSALEDLMI